MIAVRLFDPLELELPDLGLVPLRDAETGEQLWVDTHDRGFRKRFARIAAEREQTLRDALARAGVDALELSTDDDLVEAIVRFADMRTSSAGPVTIVVGSSAGSTRFLSRISSRPMPSSSAQMSHIRSRTQVSTAHGPR